MIVFPGPFESLSAIVNQIVDGPTTDTLVLADASNSARSALYPVGSQCISHAYSSGAGQLPPPTQHRTAGQAASYKAVTAKTLRQR
jgi:hypothetical protein